MVRRHFKLMILCVLLVLPFSRIRAQQIIRRMPCYQIGVCDWMILKRQKLGEFALAKTIGADGVLVDMGSLGKNVLFENKLRDPKQAEIFRHEADSLCVRVPTIAMSGFFGQSFLLRNNYEELIRDCLNTMKIFGSKVAFLPLGGCKTDWQKSDTLYHQMICRLHIVGEMALKEHVVIGIRTQLDAKSDKRLLKDVNSKGIKIYYSFQDALEGHRDICKELKELGKNSVIEIMVSNTDGVNLEDDRQIDMMKIKKTLDRLAWKGWLIVERSRDKHQVQNVRYNYGRNVKFLKEIFQ